jgi:hypothetical protein
MACRSSAVRLEPRYPFLLFHDFHYRNCDVDLEVCIPVMADSMRARGVYGYETELQIPITRV